MTQTQKVGRVLLLSITLVIGSVVVAMLGAVGLFFVQKGMEFRDTPEFYAGIGVVGLGILVNSGCLLALILIKRADHKLIPPVSKPDNKGQ